MESHGRSTRAATCSAKDRRDHAGCATRGGSKAARSRRRRVPETRKGSERRDLASIMTRIIYLPLTVFAKRRQTCKPATALSIPPSALECRRFSQLRVFFKIGWLV